MIGALTASLAELDLAWVQRLVGDATFTSLVGYDDDDGRAEADRLRFRKGWPTVLLERPVKDAVPLVTWERLFAAPSETVPPFVQLASNIWVWGPDYDLLSQIDNAMLERLGSNNGFGIGTWEDAASHIWVDCMNTSSADPVHAKLNRRRRVWEVTLRG